MARGLLRTSSLRQPTILNWILHLRQNGGKNVFFSGEGRGLLSLTTTYLLLILAVAKYFISYRKKNVN